MESFDEWITGLLVDWWRTLSSERREALTTAAGENRMDEQTLRLLIGTRCPVGPIGTRWEHEPDYHWEWNDRVKDFILNR